jgi:hypothetical protein
MNPFLLLRSWCCAAVVLLATAGCGSLDLAADGNPDRVLEGTVNAGVVLPAGTEIVVRVVAPASTFETGRPAGGDLPVAPPSAGSATERVLGSQTQVLAAGTLEPVPFRVAFVASDALLRHGLNLDVRVSIGGKLSFRTINAHVVTHASAVYRQHVAVQPIAR